ncbi:transmembrane protein adipocyte-associated 1 homolog [Lineus longissimus]|uniref:transmembrane protein adipocyte-associated 1 homolog n=1 Tax=Lineus longissimus TaxID=88925 RepID=UPI002B4D0F17
MPVKGSNHIVPIPYHDMATPPYPDNMSNIIENSNDTTQVPLVDPPCVWILYAEILKSRVRIWDLIILIPNLLFLLFIIYKCRSAFAKLRNTSSPIFTAFYGLVCAVAIISVLRSIVSMTVNAYVPAGDITDKVLWLVLRFFLLATELSVIIFGLAFGHLDSQTSIRWVLLVTSFIALAYSVTQGTLEFVHKDTIYNNLNTEFDLFGHGGMLFWFATSVFFSVAYAIITILPCTKLADRFSMPTKKSFYYYAALLAVLNLAQSIGSGLLYYREYNGMCVVDATTYLYFTCFAPLVYLTFLKDFFKVVQPSILFSYKAQVDESVEEDVNMPHQTSGSGKADSEATGSGSNYNSTPFDSLNPLYHSINTPTDLSFSNNYFSSLQVPDTVERHLNT